MARPSLGLRDTFRESFSQDAVSLDLESVRESGVGRADEDSVNGLYREMLQTQRMPDTVARKLVETETVERKRAMVIMHKKLMRSETAIV